MDVNKLYICKLDHHTFMVIQIFQVLKMKLYVLDIPNSGLLIEIRVLLLNFYIGSLYLQYDYFPLLHYCFVYQ